MPLEYFVGQRLSYDGVPCTVRYVGTVDGTKGDWVGVEWDYEGRGKHDGEHNGVRYFATLSKSKQAASFVRPTRTPDAVQSFVEAVRRKYATEEVDRRDTLAHQQQEIEMAGGKVAYEIGFDKIRAQLAELGELKIVLVDAMRIVKAGVENHKIRDVCPKIVELDLSRNLFQNGDEIINICAELDDLKSLRLSGNRLQITEEELEYGYKGTSAYAGVLDLGVDETLLSWGNICFLAMQFPDLLSLDASLNQIETLYDPGMEIPLPETITSLKLEYNSFTGLPQLHILARLPRLKSLHLKGNNIQKYRQRTLVHQFGQALEHVDLSYNQIDSWDFVDRLPYIFPGLTSLRISHNPVVEAVVKAGAQATSIDEGYMLTLARLPKLKYLNFSNITDADRTNAEMFYLSRIAKEMAEIPEELEISITAKHRRYAELCHAYGKPVVARKDESTNPNYLEARLITFTFYMPANTKQNQQEEIVRVHEIPRGFDTYRIKNIVGKLFAHRPLGLRLVWETGEWDPVAGYEDLSDRSEYDESVPTKPGVLKEGGKWLERKVEVEDGTRQVGFLIDDNEARVRVDIIDGVS